jgi:hypothetical protein
MTQRQKTEFTILISKCYFSAGSPAVKIVGIVLPVFVVGIKFSYGGLV